MQKKRLPHKSYQARNCLFNSLFSASNSGDCTSRCPLELPGKLFLKKFQSLYHIQRLWLSWFRVGLSLLSFYFHLFLKLCTFILNYKAPPHKGWLRMESRPWISWFLRHSDMDISIVFPFWKGKMTLSEFTHFRICLLLPWPLTPEDSISKIWKQTR